MRIAVDFDDVIHPWEDNKTKPTEFNGKPISGAINVLKDVKDLGATIIIHTARLNGDYEGEDKLPLAEIKRHLEDYLIKYGVPYDQVWDKQGKPSADVYIDDRALRFEGDWDKTFKELKRILKVEGLIKESIYLLN